ncbi:MAG: hypothetical protein EZS28_033968, partial [Streblomastix strix]
MSSSLSPPRNTKRPGEFMNQFESKLQNLQEYMAVRQYRMEDFKKQRDERWQQLTAQLGVVEKQTDEVILTKDNRKDLTELLFDGGDIVEDQIEILRSEREKEFQRIQIERETWNSQIATQFADNATDKYSKGRNITPSPLLTINSSSSQSGQSTSLQSSLIVKDLDIWVNDFKKRMKVNKDENRKKLQDQYRILEQEVKTSSGKNNEGNR